MPRTEDHVVEKLGWLRAAVLGANDGIVSTASLIAGVASSHASQKSILIAGIAGLVAGALSMAAGEYVSVSSQADAEKADLARERRELAEQPEFELQELTDVYTKRGVEPGLAREVAKQLTAHDALGTHAREELGITEMTTAQPIVAAIASAMSFAVGAAVPLIAAIISPESRVTLVVTAASLVCLAVLGAIGARIGKADVWWATLRVTFWGALAMALTALIGHFSDAVI
ncbi:VIT family protein [Hyphomicrobium sp.]|uniref:VIT1/CCC1 transporter family protein n=1 Tax=Hyphomicrobium sp. TaxID=82 RepID=UPI002D796B95|nr:VIT family protein [Hyphomicrobium sp.]HET6390611.1 VIT family protein [Hyphomicrobium sp.]